MSKEQIEELESLLSDFEDIILKVDNMMLQFEPDSDTYNIFSDAFDKTSEVQKQLASLLINNVKTKT
jgi:hypothetical protein